jgi:hypothetical protein
MIDEVPLFRISYTDIAEKYDTMSGKRKELGIQLVSQREEWAYTNTHNKKQTICAIIHSR